MSLTDSQLRFNGLADLIAADMRNRQVLASSPLKANAPQGPKINVKAIT